MKKLLIAYDGTPGAELAIKDLTRAGLPERAEAKVATFADVWIPPVPPPDDTVNRERHLAIHEKAADLLRETGKTAILGARLVHERFPNWKVSNVAKADSPAWGIIAEAKRWGADLIVIGSHGRNPLEKFFLGSVSYKVAAEATCSVRIVRPGHSRIHGPAKILIGVDASSDAQLAIEEVLSRSWQRGTEIHLLTVIDPKLKSSIFRRPENITALDRVEDWIAPILENYRSKFDACDLTAHSHIMEGDPKSTLLRQALAWDVDSIFLGARGLDHGDRLYLGTLASAICTRAHCSVEVVRGAPQA
ncbi:MAG TPA: universal stress protein [Candidatus Kapabacteria bacterium]|nr:universal stress protein [Candidatus Kapabacteria bacterium]